MNSMSEKKWGICLLAWSFACAVGVLLFTTRSSVMFVCNNWDDANSYFTMGKGMMNGMVIYRDLYDQKGPFLYLMYGIAYLISKKTFFGVFLFEILAGTFFLFFAGKLINRKSNRYMALLLVPVLGAAAYSSWSFYYGGAAEEFCLPMLAYAVLALDELLSEDISNDRRIKLFRNVGLCAGVVAQVKYTMLGFFFAWFVIAAIYLCTQTSVKEALHNALTFIGFALIPSVPWLIYFLITGSLDDWYRCYIYNNLFFYSNVSTGEYSLANKFYEILKTLYWLVQDSWTYFIWIIAGFILQPFMEKGILKKISSIIIFSFTYFVIFIGGNKLAYYSIPLITLAIYGAAYAGKLLAESAKKLGMGQLKVLALPLAVIILAGGTFFAAQISMNAEYRSYKKEDVWLFEAAKQLTQEDTLLELNTVDAGLYTITGVVPTCEYFQTNGIGLDTMFEEQKKYLKEGRTDYVLAVGFEPEFININYKLIAKYKYREQDQEKQYFLYGKK